MRRIHSSEFDLAPWGPMASLHEWLGPAPADERAPPAARVVARQASDPAGLAVSVSRLSKRYGERQVLRDVDLTIAPGEFVAIVGRSGCGKSTLLRQLAGLESADGGDLMLDGRPVEKARGELRIMYQDARLLPWKRVLENVALGLTGHNARALAHEALAQVGLVERGFDWPSVLSGGQRQRVALARALVHRPRLLLLDEPLGALDALTRIEMQQLIERLWQRHRFTALLVTHDVSEAVALADRVVLIEEQRVAFDERVSLPRPRSRGAAGFATLEDRVLRRVLRQPPAIEERPPPEPLPPGLRFAI
ncbi:ATP-binding cassette domain-containing protein [Ideonella sp. YS5]|uniref:ATP-binding cassette domain-containing protein n=1 Tax=Ideonella sp. YS5 TaxID=3453714 RepID=UPI003EEAE96A